MNPMSENYKWNVVNEKLSCYVLKLSKYKWNLGARDAFHQMP